MGTDFDLDGGLIARCVTAGEGKRQDYETCTMLVHPVQMHRDLAPALTSNYGKQPDSSETSSGPMLFAVQPVAFHPLQDPISSTDGTTHALGCGSTGGQASIAVATVKPIALERTTALDANSPPPALLTSSQVRRLLPEECESLMGFPRKYTAIPWRGKPASDCPDGPRFKALGNSWAVPVAAWIGARIQAALMQQANDSGQGVV